MSVPIIGIIGSSPRSKEQIEADERLKQRRLEKHEALRQESASLRSGGNSTDTEAVLGEFGTHTPIASSRRTPTFEFHINIINEELRDKLLQFLIENKMFDSVASMIRK